MEESPRLQVSDAVVIAGDLLEVLEETDFDGELSPEFPIKEEMIEEVMQELYKEITCSPPSPSCSSTESASTESIQSPSSVLSQIFVDNRKSESCGASVSDKASTVMAGVEFVGAVAGGRYGGDGGNGGFWVEEERKSRCDCNYGDGIVMAGCDEAEFGDERLERVMDWVPVLELEGWS